MAPTYGVLLFSFSKHSHQRNFVPLYQAHPRIRPIAVADYADIDPQLAALNRRWAADLDIPYIVGLEEALALKGVDIVSVGHEIERRCEVIQRAAAAGKHLWIDKFTGADLAEAEQAAQAVEAAGVKSIVPSYTYGALARQSRQVLQEEVIGPLLGLHIDILFSKGLPHPIPATPAPPLAPAGRWKYPDLKREILTVGSYAVGLVQLCLDQITRVYGRAGAHFFPEHAAAGCEDFGVLTLTDCKGRVATLCAGRIGVASHASGGPSRALVVGARGTALIDGKRPAIDAFLRQELIDARYLPDPDDPMQWASGPSPLAVSADADGAGLAAGLDDLVQALDQDRLPAFTARHARDHLQILLAAYESICSGTEVHLAPGQEASR